jgi:hypothetical protein
MRPFLLVYLTDSINEKGVPLPLRNRIPFIEREETINAICKKSTTKEEIITLLLRETNQTNLDIVVNIFEFKNITNLDDFKIKLSSLTKSDICRLIEKYLKEYKSYVNTFEVGYFD